MPDYWTGLVSGFQDRREKAMLDNYAKELQNRQAADRVFQHLLTSRDPVIQEMALAGLMNPVNKKKGFAGFMGEYESNPVLGQIVGAMNEMIPDTSGAPIPPARPGSAAMSTNQPVRAGSAPIPEGAGGLPGIPLPPEQPPISDTSSGVTAAMPPDQEVMGGGGVPFPPGPPQTIESPLKRRGTGVPTAEEIAEMQARIPLETRIGMAQQYLNAEDAQRATMGILGAPQRVPVPSAMTQWGVRINGVVQPVIFDPENRQFVMSGGQPLPPGAEMVRMGGGGSVPRRAKEPDPSSPTGWSAVFYDTGSGEELYRVPDTPYVAPAEGTTTILDQNNNPTVVTTPRVGQGGGGQVVGGAPNPQPSVGQSDAQALLSIIRQRIQAGERPQFGMPRTMTPQQKDQIVLDEATRAGLPYQTLFEVEQAARVPSARQVAPQPNAPPSPGPAVRPPSSLADRIRQRALQNRTGGGGETGAGTVQPPPARPTTPPARSTGAGPRQ